MPSALTGDQIVSSPFASPTAKRHVAENQGQRRDGPAVGKGADHFSMGNLALLVELPADQAAVVRAGVERVAFAVHRHRANVRDDVFPQDGLVGVDFLVAHRRFGGDLPENGNCPIGEPRGPSDGPGVGASHEAAGRWTAGRLRRDALRLCERSLAGTLANDRTA